MKGAITDYIPQRPPIVMIDKLVYADETTAVSSFQILPTTLFVENEKFTEPGLVENIAQTAAAMVGYQCSLQNEPVPIGFIAAVKDLKINFIPVLFSTIQTKVAVINTVMNITIVEGRVEQLGKLLCSCEMKILIQK
jgi:predicted hotdog family 3-hydroxylacyl-ACP dehydratase